VLERHSNVDITGAQHPQGLRRLGLRQHELQARRLGQEPGRGCRDQGAERGRECGEPHAAAPQSDEGRQLGFSRIQPADDLLGSLC
jgi:hypothetical protein